MATQNPSRETAGYPEHLHETLRTYAAWLVTSAAEALYGGGRTFDAQEDWDVFRTSRIVLDERMRTFDLVEAREPLRPGDLRELAAYAAKQEHYELQEALNVGEPGDQIVQRAERIRDLEALTV